MLWRHQYLLLWMVEVNTPRYLKVEGRFTHKIEGPWPFHFKHSHRWKKAEPVQVRITLRLKEQRSIISGCKMDVKSTWIPTWHQLDRLFHKHLDYFQNHLLEIGLIQNHDTMALRDLTTVVYLILSCTRTCMNSNSLKEHLVESLVTYDFKAILEGPWPHYMVLEVSWNDLCTLHLGSQNFMVISLDLCVKWSFARSLSPSLIF